MSKRYHVMLDVDGVLADYTSSVVAWVNAKCDTAYTVKDVTGWDILKALNVPESVQQQFWDEITTAPDWCYNLKPYPWAKTLVQVLGSHPNVGELTICTSPMSGKHWAGERLQWLYDYLRIPLTRVVLASNKAKHVQGDVLVDDSPKHVNAWASQPGRHSILWRMPWNQDEELQPNVYSANNLDMLCEQLESLARRERP